MSLKEMLIGTGGGGLHKVPLDPKTVFKLGANGLVGAQNNTFVDSSPANNTITRNGNVTQGTFTPYTKEAGKWSNYFDGGQSYLYNSTFPSIGTSDFKIEFDIFISRVVGSDSHIFSLRNSSDTGNYLILDYTGGKLYVVSGTIYAAISTNTLPLGRFFKLSVSRSGNTCTIDADGVVSTGAFSAGYNISATGMAIGASPVQSSRGSDCYISNLKITKAGVVVLDTCKDNRFKDNSIYNHTLTPTGNVKVSPFSPYANSVGYDASAYGGSGYFDGSGDYLRLTNHIQTGDFSYEFDVMLTTYPTTGYQQIIGNGNISNTFGVTFGLSAPYKLRLNKANIGDVLASNTEVKLGQFYTFKVERVSGVFRMYMNGVLDSGTYSDSNNYTLSTCDIGGGFIGYMSRFIHKQAGTEVLNLKFNNAGIRDESGMNCIETVGDAKVSSDGTGAVFDGVNDLLIVNTTDNYAVGTIFSTSIEFYPTAQAGTLIRSKVGTTGLGIGWQDATHFGIQDNGTWKLTTATMPNLNAWNTLVITRTGTGANQTTMTLNGNTVTGTVDSAWITPTAYSIGCASDLTSGFKGTIKNLTITKG